VRLTGVAIANCSHSPSLGVADLVTDARPETVGTVALQLLVVGETDCSGQIIGGRNTCSPALPVWCCVGGRLEVPQHCYSCY